MVSWLPRVSEYWYIDEILVSLVWFFPKLQISPLWWSIQRNCKKDIRMLQHWILVTRVNQWHSHTNYYTLTRACTGYEVNNKEKKKLCI
jgi:hypothetical protein